MKGLVLGSSEGTTNLGHKMDMRLWVKIIGGDPIGKLVME